MSTELFKIKEIYGATKISKECTIQDENLVLLSRSKKSLGFLTFLTTFFREVFLPQGYPKSVSEDYATYQLYDTIQAFCSRITGTLTTKAILKSVGVGDANATPLGAALSWIFKDGTGMISSIIFAWHKGTDFDSNCKKWRLFADILNDFAMFLEMLLPYFPNYGLFLLCITTAMKAGVGVSGSATRAAITQHQAKKDNMADVSAKDGSQETAVNLLASFFAVGILTIFPEEKFDWFLFVVFTILHLAANYNAVKSLKFDTLNEARALIVLKKYLDQKQICGPEEINSNEAVVLGFGPTDKSICGFKIKIGASFTTVLQNTDFKNLSECRYEISKNGYFIFTDLKKNIIYIFLIPNEKPETVLKAYFQAFIIAWNFSKTDKLEKSLLKNFIFSISDTEYRDITLRTEEFVQKLRQVGWETEKHSLKIQEWRIESFSV